MLWRVSEWLWKAPFASCTNKLSSLCLQSKIDNSSDISYSIFWILRGVGFPWDTNLSASLSLYLQRACWDSEGIERGEDIKDLRWGKGEKLHRGVFSFFDFISSVSHFRAWQMELYCSATMNDPVSLPHPPPPSPQQGRWNRLQN